jgi:hypothetical protein
MHGTQYFRRDKLPKGATEHSSGYMPIETIAKQSVLLLRAVHRSVRGKLPLKLPL